MDNSNKSSDQIKSLTKALLLSGVLNIVLMGLLFYWLIKESPPRPYFELKPADQQEQQAPLAVDHSSAEILRNFRLLSLEQLVAKLSNTQLVENGFSQRDLALAALVTFHHFDLSRALSKQPTPSQQRKVVIGKNRRNMPVEVVIYPALSDVQYQDIIRFAHTERWPVTSQGLFKLLSKQQDQADPTLVDAFYFTPEFQAVETIFKRSEVQVEKPELLKVILQGDWNLLSGFAEQQRIAQDLSPAKRQRFMLDYIERKSQAAAYLLLKTDREFAGRKLDDNHVMLILDMIAETTPEAARFVLMLLTSPRNDQVRQLAAGRLFEYAGEQKPEKNLYQAALSRFLPHLVVPQKGVEVPKATKPVLSKNSGQVAALPAIKSQVKKPVTPRVQTYTVQNGDSLWKIAKRFKVDVKQLKAYNNLKSDVLKPGSTLKIPPNEPKKK